MLITSTLLPIVFWHGMGDSCCDGISRVEGEIQSWYPGTFTYSVRIGDDKESDKKAGFFDKIDRQELSAIPELKNGFNGIGFSQGGLFLRGLVQKCDSIKMVNLMTFGSPHAGVADIPNCEEESANCSLMRSIVKTGVYWSWIQSSVVQAQYYKDWKNLDKYLESNIFLPDLNQELEDINPDYTNKMKSLKRLVLIKFEQDHMIVPKETAVESLLI
ncbi:hypothetical protein HK103_005868 [Boothiomyces macroporosus]|uniref:Palmitoyl-protein thioesterase 1 n=1 Tax=Boothiomyces macroporosus TaxID=261099 RepID=A0AAD5UIA6_9FUNG|nr:hypothetical protein HK103_005868 [Boothiomyces macroporosus]